MDRQRREEIREWAQTYLINGGQAGVLELLSDLEAAEEKLRIAKEALDFYAYNYDKNGTRYPNLYTPLDGETARKALEEIGQ